jgi:hypothetical protein
MWRTAIKAAPKFPGLACVILYKRKQHTCSSVREFVTAPILSIPEERSTSFQINEVQRHVFLHAAVAVHQFWSSQFLSITSSCMCVRCIHTWQCTDLESQHIAPHHAPEDSYISVRQHRITRTLLP